jgi:hypothetical protein
MGTAIGVPLEWAGKERVMPEAMDLLPPHRHRHAADSLARETSFPGAVLIGADTARGAGRLSLRPGMASQAGASARSAPLMRASSLLAMQRQFGNGYVQRLVTVAQREPEALRRRGAVQRCACGGVVVGGGQCAACRAKEEAARSGTAAPTPAGPEQSTRSQGGLPTYLRAALAGRQPDVARFQRGFAAFRDRHAEPTLDRYAEELGEPAGRELAHAANPTARLQRSFTGGDDNLQPFCFIDMDSTELKTVKGKDRDDARKKLSPLRTFQHCHDGACRSASGMDECANAPSGETSQADTGIGDQFASASSSAASAGGGVIDGGGAAAASGLGGMLGDAGAAAAGGLGGMIEDAGAGAVAAVGGMMGDAGSSVGGMLEDAGSAISDFFS